MNQELARVISNAEVAANIHLIWLESPHVASSARPGQFLMVRCGEGTLLRRPLSIHQVDTNRTGLALLFAAVGKGTDWLARCGPGENIDIFGPLGNGFSILPKAKRLLLAGGGIGVAPLCFLAEQTAAKGYEVRMLRGAACASQLYSLSAQYDIATVTEDGSAGEKGMITALLPAHTAWADQVFACGPMPMYQTMANMPELKGKPVQVSLEIMMGCGFGVCYGCTIKTRRGLKQVCQDGPVFDLDDLIW